MDYSIAISAAAKENIREAFNYYEAKVPGLGDRFLEQLENAKKHISKFPFASSISYKNTIIIPMKVFPYGLQILIDKKNKKIILISVHSFYQNPQIWNP